MLPAAVDGAADHVTDPAAGASPAEPTSGATGAVGGTPPTDAPSVPAPPSNPAPATPSTSDPATSDPATDAVQAVNQTAGTNVPATDPVLDGGAVGGSGPAGSLLGG